MTNDFLVLLLCASLALNAVLLWKKYSTVFIQKEKEEENLWDQAEKLLALAFSGNEIARLEIENGIANPEWKFFGIIIFNPKDDVILSVNPSKPIPLVVMRQKDGSKAWQRSGPMPIGTLFERN